MTGLVAGIGLRGVLAGAGAFFQRIPPKAWLVIGCAVAAFIGVLWHRHEVKLTIADAKAEQQTQDNAAWQKALAKQHEAAMKWKAGFDKRGEAISADERKLNEKAVAYNAALARDLSLHGPGAASASGCRQGDHTGFPGAARGSVQASSAEDVAGPSVSAANRQRVPAIVDWQWLVARGQEHDDLLSEVQTWRDWYRRQSSAWPK